MAQPPLPSLPAPLLVVAHDAGAANHILAWVRAGWLRPGRLCLQGPALALWQQAFGAVDSLPLEQALEGCASVLSGTGWASTLEHDARRLARERGLLSVAVIDHWTNYPQRFERGGATVLPGQLWVTDSDALRLAQQQLPGVPVLQQPNRYLASLVEEVARQPAPPANAAPNRILYVLEPIRDAWGARPEPGEFSALDYFMQCLPRLGLAGPVELRLRPHPSDPPGKYDAWLARHQGGAVAPLLDTSPSLAAGLAWATLVAGCQTYAMVVALAAGRRVVSSVPPGVPPCVLPQDGILRLRDRL